MFSRRGTITNSTISGNHSAGQGGGLYNSGISTVTNSTISGNTNNSVGGAVLNEGNLTLTNTTISGNTGSYGGGVDNKYILTLNRTLISGNNDSSGSGLEVINGAGATVSANNFNLLDTAVMLAYQVSAPVLPISCPVRH